MLKPFLEAAMFEFAEFGGWMAASDRHSTLLPKGTVRNGGARQRQRPDWRPGSGPSTPFELFTYGE